MPLYTFPRVRIFNEGLSDHVQFLWGMVLKISQLKESEILDVITNECEN